VALREMMQKQLANFNLDREKMIKCQDLFNIHCEDMKNRYSDNKIINDFLAGLSDASNHNLVLEDLEKALKTFRIEFDSKKSQMLDFKEGVKQDCMMDQNKFSFHEIPDLILKKQISRKNYESLILKMLVKVKKLYLVEKLKDKEVEDLDSMPITDDDLADLDLFQQVIS
jgi:hypothetical protein